MKLGGVVADGQSHFRGFTDGVEGGVIAGSELAKLLKLRLDGGCGSHTREGTAEEHLFDGVEKSVVDAVTEGQMKRSPVG